jgi:hypothetical protein
MKVYWSKNRGCVITSANASSNALGKNGLKEAGIWLPSRAVNIRRLIGYSTPRKIRATDFYRLDREAREHKKNSRKASKIRSPAPDFVQWCTAPYRSVWKIACIDTEVTGVAKVAKERSYSEYGHKEPHTWASCRRNRVRKADWLLTFTHTERGAKSAHWLYVDLVVKVSRQEGRYYYRGFPYHAVQVNSPSKYPSPPFQITSRFVRALSTAVKHFTVDRILDAKTDSPSVRLLKLIETEYQCNGARNAKRAGTRPILRFKSLRGQTVVVTGIFRYGTRDKVRRWLLRLGAEVPDSVTRKTNVLIVGTHRLGKNLRKIQDAREIGVTTLTEARFRRQYEV